MMTRKGFIAFGGKAGYMEIYHIKAKEIYDLFSVPK
jgi:hypothetical protein